MPIILLPPYRTTSPEIGSPPTGSSIATLATRSGFGISSSINVSTYDVSKTSISSGYVVASQYKNSGKHYVEMEILSLTSLNIEFGVYAYYNGYHTRLNFYQQSGQASSSWREQISNNGSDYNNFDGPSPTIVGDVFGLIADLDTKAIRLYKNGVFFRAYAPSNWNTYFGSTATQTAFFVGGYGAPATVRANLGQRAFKFYPGNETNFRWGWYN